MTKIQLISGFLGTGKTTFLKRFISYLKKSNKKICVLEFDFGAINVDTLILYNYDNQIDIESITVNNDHDSYLRRLKTKLIAIGMKHYDYLLIEPSGIFNPNDLLDILYEEPINNWFELDNVINIVDPTYLSLDDISTNGMDLIRTVAEIFDIHGIETEIIAASVRHPMHVTDAALAGAHIATVPAKLIDQMLNHPLTTQGIEKFKKDWADAFGNK